MQSPKLSKNSNSGRPLAGLWPAGVVIVATAALLAMAAAALLRQQAAQERAAIQAVAHTRGHTALQALAAGLRAQGRMGLYRTDRLQVILEELAATPDVVGIVLASGTGDILLQVGDRPLDGEPDGDVLAMSESFRLPAMPFRGPHGRETPPPVASGTGEPRLREFVLTVMLDASSMNAQMTRAARQYRLQTLGAAVVCLLGAVLALIVLRHRRLAADLLLEREQRRTLERLSQVGAGLAHETKNPLSVVRGMAQAIVENSEATPRIRRLGQNIVDESDRTVGQINAFLGLARPQCPEPAPLRLKELAEGLCAVVEQEAKEAAVDLTVEGPETVVSADSALLRRALLNLLINAFRAAPGGHVAVRVHEQGQQAAVSVSDDGCGIAADDLGRVTEPYFSRFAGGTGIGLAIVEEIAHAHGWRLRVASTEGTGTTVSLNGLQRLESPL